MGTTYDDFGYSPMSHCYYFGPLAEAATTAKTTIYGTSRGVLAPPTVSPVARGGLGLPPTAENS